MSAGDSIACWIEQVKVGDEDAAHALWTRYFPDLVILAQQRLRHTNRRVADEEDIVLSAFASFFRAAQEGRLHDLADREGLWRLLSRITHRKAVDLYRHHSRKKRGEGRVLDETRLAAGQSSTFDGLAQISDKQLEPQLAAMITEECRCLLEMLPDAELRQIAIGKMDGFTNEEIASQVDCSLRTVERRLKLIRKLWETYMADDRSGDEE